VIVVSDTSPLLNLEAIGRLELLSAVHGRVIIPESVLDELSALEGATTTWAGLAWLEVRSVSDRRQVEILEASLDRGEAEAIVLGIELKADLLLIDETAGRREAQRHGLRVIGLVGTLLAAKQRGIIPAIAPLLDTLRARAGFWLSDAMYAHALDLAGEQR
jgi:predicted nucleic acid-binding protein